MLFKILCDVDIEHIQILAFLFSFSLSLVSLSLSLSLLIFAILFCRSFKSDDVNISFRLNLLSTRVAAAAGYLLLLSSRRKTMSTTSSRISVQYISPVESQYTPKCSHLRLISIINEYIGFFQRDCLLGLWDPSPTSWSSNNSIVFAYRSFLTLNIMRTEFGFRIPSECIAPATRAHNHPHWKTRMATGKWWSSGNLLKRWSCEDFDIDVFYWWHWVYLVKIRAMHALLARSESKIFIQTILSNHASALLQKWSSFESFYLDHSCLFPNQTSSTTHAPFHLTQPFHNWHKFY